MKFAVRAVLTACLLGSVQVLASTEIYPLRIDGLITAVFSPYYTNGMLNVHAVSAQAQYLKKTGVKGVFVGGSTGDSLSLTVSERKHLAEAWAAEAKANDLIFIVHVGADALGDVLELAEHAAHLKADAIGCMASPFFKPATVQALAQWLQQVGKAAPRLPLYYYHIPSMTGVNFKMVDLLKAIEQVGIPQFSGIKYTGLFEMEAFPDFQRSQRYGNGRYEILCAREEMTIEALSVGARGFIGSQFNFVGDLYAAIGKAWPNMTRARDLQLLGLDLLDAWGNVPAGVNGNRMVMELTSVPIGPARLPNLQADAATDVAFRSSIRAWCEKAGHVVDTTFELCKSPKLQPLESIQV